jgi:glycine/serine hydroxymethyltransferase
MTTRGMGEAEAAKLAELMIQTLKAKNDDLLKSEIKTEVRKLCQAFPVPERFV